MSYAQPLCRQKCFCSSSLSPTAEHRVESYSEWGLSIFVDVLFVASP